jgi:hypothetical protein
MQVPAACISSTQKVYEMSSAILLYRERHGQTVFASVHDVKVSKEGAATIEAGTPVSKTGLMKMMQTLVPEDYAPAELLGGAHPRQRERPPRVVLQTSKATGVVQKR